MLQYINNVINEFSTIFATGFVTNNGEYEDDGVTLKSHRVP